MESGQLGCWNRNGKPVVNILPGSYWNFSPVHSYYGSYGMTGNIDFLGLTMGQVGQSEAMVILDPQNRVFIIRNGGFVAYGASGRFRIVAVVDTLDLGENAAIRDQGSKQIIGWKKEIKHNVDGNVKNSITVATFFNVPANNVVLVQRYNQLISLGAGQHGNTCCMSSEK